MLVTQNFTAQGLPLSHPRIGWQNYVRLATITATSQVTGYEADSIANALTWDFWKPAALPGTVTFDFGQSESVNYCGIAAHTLGSLGCSVLLQYWNGSSWVTCASCDPADDSPIVFLFDSISATKWRITVDLLEPSSELPVIGVVYIGPVLEVERRIYQGYTPISLSATTIIRPQNSEGGQWLGRSVSRQGVTTTIGINNLSANFIWNSFKPFMEAAKSYPFFWLWRPSDYPNDIAYVWTASDIVPTNSGPSDLMSVSFGVSGTNG